MFNFTSLISNKWFVQDVIGTSSAHGVGLFQYCSLPEKGMGMMNTCYRLGLNLSVSYGFEVKFSSKSGPIVFYGIVDISREEYNNLSFLFGSFSVDNFDEKYPSSFQTQ